MRRMAAGNWKMNGTAADLGEVTALLAAHPDPACDLVLCPPSTLLARMAAIAEGTALMTGGQDCHAEPSGAHTGDISAPMLRDAGATHVILGHSERRAGHAEADALVQAKVHAALAAGLTAIVCVGETEAQRDAGETRATVAAQVGGSLPHALPEGVTPDRLVVAYEPVWAIGTGRTPPEDEIADLHAHIRALLRGRFMSDANQMRILYGGSVKPANAAAIFGLENVDGALVGGASLKAADFGAIVAALGD